tara:strand:- start:9417 stop:10106 length:690 start_codon:yes stop_codon:yes gene_type:complete
MDGVTRDAKVDGGKSNRLELRGPNCRIRTQYANRGSSGCNAFQDGQVVPGRGQRGRSNGPKFDNATQHAVGRDCGTFQLWPRLMIWPVLWNKCSARHPDVAFWHPRCGEQGGADIALDPNRHDTLQQCARESGDDLRQCQQDPAFHQLRDDKPRHRHRVVPVQQSRLNRRNGRAAGHAAKNSNSQQAPQEPVLFPDGLYRVRVNVPHASIVRCHCFVQKVGGHLATGLH